MTTLLVERVERPGAAEPSAGPTLERLISGVWHDLSQHATAACPVCAGAMSRPSAADPHGSCSACGTQLW